MLRNVCSFDQQMKFILCFYILSSILYFSSLKFAVKSSHKYDLARKKSECQSFEVCPRQHSHNFCHLMIVLVRVLSAKPVLMYKHKFEAIL